MKRYFFGYIILIACNLFAQSEREKNMEIVKKHPVKVLYTNYRHATEWRTIVPQDCFWGHTEYHTEDQWLMRVWDCERNAERIYAMKDIKEWQFDK